MLRLKGKIMGRLDALDEIDENTLGPANESATMRKKRMRSIRIAHVGMFIFGLGFSIVITGVYPYMIQGGISIGTFLA